MPESDDPPEPRPTVLVIDERAEPADGPAIDADRLRSLAEAVLVDEGLGRRLVELTVHAVDEAPIADLNAAHLGGQGPTDVLAFPVDDPAEVPDGMPVLLGDVVICPVVAQRQAAERGLDGELALLLVHGILHLLGHDHVEPVETARMQARERVLLDRHTGAGAGR